MLMAIGAVLLVSVLFWLLSLYLKDVSIVDIYWGLSFLIFNSVILFCVNPNPSYKNYFIFILVTVWSLRLSTYIFVRKLGEPAEDWRYANMRKNSNANFAYRSLVTIFLLQACLSMIINTPLTLSLMQPTYFYWPLDSFAYFLWIVGFIWEAGADLQLMLFKSKEENKGKVLNTGFWKHSRHPNYFGEFLIWWAYFIFIIPVNFGLVSIFSPILMSYLLMRVSGVTMLESGLKKTKPKYAEYIKNTPAFFPFKFK